MKKIFLLFSRYLLIAVIFSFLGWLFEVSQAIILQNGYSDRGFLFLPLCPIYGFTLLLIYFIAGTPKEPRGLLEKIENKLCLYIYYFLVAFLVPTLMELIVGFFFDEYFDKILWSYEGMPYSNIYISLLISLGWGLLITLVMSFVFPLVKKLVFKIKDNICIFLGIFLSIILLIDFSYNILISIK